jgi:hypothetical protein
MQIINSPSNKTDPIRTRYFTPLERAESISDVAFYCAAILSIVVLLIDPKKTQLYADTQIAFLITALAGFIVSIAVRVYFSPRAQDVRLGDFLSNAFGVKLTPERTENYYNSGASDPMRKIGAQALENSLFTKEIARRMCWRERAIITVYVIAWLFAAFNRNTGFDVMIVASQIVFSEQLVSRAVRLEWLRSRSESVFEALYQLLQSNPQQGSPEGATFEARIIQELVKYENTKSNAAVTISSRIFERVNPDLSKQWDKIRHDLKL